MPSINFPGNANRSSDKIEYCYSMQEKLRLLHNMVGTWRREGYTQAEYDDLPQRIRNKMPYKAQLTEAEWQIFLNGFYDKRSELVIKVMHQMKTQLLNSNRWQTKVDDLGD